MVKEVAIEILGEQIEKINTLLNLGYESDQFIRWRRDTAVAIEHIFGNKTRHIKDYYRIGYAPASILSWDQNYEIKIQNAYIKGLNQAKIILQSMVAEIEKYGLVDDEKSKSSTASSAVSIINLIFRMFHLVALQLPQVHDDHETLNVENEYDVQDLLYKILKLYFDDIKPEEWKPDYAGGNSRMDFLLKNEKIVIEIKHTSKDLKEKKVAQELIFDIAHYAQHPLCKRLYCFVYDPEGWIAEPRAIEKDLSGIKEGLDVHVLIFPDRN